tara:strand:- start:102 stop:506 length:405 start_codon:yes stop_codon:yes gene_type:complete
MRAIVFLLVGAFATPGFAQGSGELSPNTSEHLFSCGAAFAMIAKVYEEAGDAKKSAVYETKFDMLAGRAEGFFEQSQRSKSDAGAYMQQHINSLAGVAEKDGVLFVKWVRTCDLRFPDPKSIGPIIGILRKEVP